MPSLAGEARVVNINAREAFDVYIGRSSRWGNPFLIGRDGSRERVVERYREWIQRRPDLLLALSALQGKRLGCHCSPAGCHGDVLVELVREYTCQLCGVWRNPGLRCGCLLVDDPEDLAPKWGALLGYRCGLPFSDGRATHLVCQLAEGHEGDHTCIAGAMGN